MRNAPADFGLLYQFENAFAQVKGTWNQDLIQPQQFALQRLPDATVTGRQELFNNLMFADYDAEAVDFYRYQGIDGLRLDANPRVTLPWRLGDYLQGYGQIGSQMAFYDTDRSQHPYHPGRNHAGGRHAAHLRSGRRRRAVLQQLRRAEPI